MDSETKQGGRFDETHWTMVIAAGQENTTKRGAALQQLCRTYWYPLYAFVRREGHAKHDAEDLTQAFFTRLLAKGDLAEVSREKGKFRSFLLGALKHYLIEQRRNANRLKRGGGKEVVSLDATLEPDSDREDTL